MVVYGMVVDRRAAECIMAAAIVELACA